MRCAGYFLVSLFLAGAAGALHAAERPAPTSAAAHRPAALPAPAVGADYVLGPEDTIRISVFKHPEYDRETTVQANGKIVYQIPEGELEVAGRTRAQVEAIIREALKFDLRNPQVTVEVVKERPQPIYVTGKVGAAQTLQWQPGWRVREVLARVGGTPIKPELANVILRRRNGDQIRVDLKALLLDHDEGANLLLEPGDQLDVQELPVHKVHIMGEVKLQGTFELPEGAGIVQALALAGGLTDQAAQSKVMVMRGSEQTFPIDLRPLMIEGRLPSPGFRLQADDVIVVPQRIAKFAVLGNVGNPGYKDLPENERVTVAGAITLAGGAGKKAKLSEVVLIRGADGTGKAERKRIDVRAVMTQGRFEKDEVVQANDVIYVPTSGRMEPFEGLWLLQGIDWVLNFFRFGL